MQTRTLKTLSVTALGLAAVAAAAGTASAAPTNVLGSLPLGSDANLVPGAADTTAGAQSALTNGTSALPTKGLLPSGNHISGKQVTPASTLLGGLPTGTGVLS